MDCTFSSCFLTFLLLCVRYRKGFLQKWMQCLQRLMKKSKFLQCLQKMFNSIREKIHLQLVRPIDFVTFTSFTLKDFKQISTVINRFALSYLYINSSRIKAKRGFRDQVSSLQFKDEKIEAQGNEIICLKLVSQTGGLVIIRHIFFFLNNDF